MPLNQFERRFGGPQKRSARSKENKNILLLPGNSPGRETHFPSLHELSYPSLKVTMCSMYCMWEGLSRLQFKQGGLHIVTILSHVTKEIREDVQAPPAIPGGAVLSYFLAE
jgi:hypothetical protein